jgi:hypothetical protein
MRTKAHTIGAVIPSTKRAVKHFLTSGAKFVLHMVPSSCWDSMSLSSWMLPVGVFGGTLGVVALSCVIEDLVGMILTSES